PDQDVTTVQGIYPKFDDSEQIYSNFSKKVPLDNLESYLIGAATSIETELEFKSVPMTVEKSTSAGKILVNKLKNRYGNNLPFDENRVILPKIPNQDNSDYINASY
ncbi:unnamed protein product, partial [Meganyctiphanes norvegica]